MVQQDGLLVMTAEGVAGTYVARIAAKATEIESLTLVVTLALAAVVLESSGPVRQLTRFGPA